MHWATKHFPTRLVMRVPLNKLHITVADASCCMVCVTGLIHRMRQITLTPTRELPGGLDLAPDDVSIVPRQPASPAGHCQRLRRTAKAGSRRGPAFSSLITDHWSLVWTGGVGGVWLNCGLKPLSQRS